MVVGGIGEMDGAGCCVEWDSGGGVEKAGWRMEWVEVGRPEGETASNEDDQNIDDESIVITRGQRGRQSGVGVFSITR